MKKKSLKKIDKLIIFFSLVIIFSALGLLFSRIGFHSNIKKEITYDEIKNIDYKVYLKQNDYFIEEYLPKNQTYISSLIDYIFVDFDYQFKLTENISGSYSYYIKAVVEANQAETSGNYFTKEYILSDLNTKTYKNTDTITIKDNIKVNYQMYNELLTNFKNDYNINMNGDLKIVLEIKNEIDDNYNSKIVNKESQLELNIPLTTNTVEVPITIDEKNNHGTIINYTIYKNGILYSLAKIFGVSFYIIGFFITLYLIYLSFLSIKMESLYHKKLHKILKVYDGIIVNLKNVPQFNKNNLLIVSSFEELIDAYSEVRKPINFIEKQDGAIFLIITEKYNYYFKLKRELFTNNEKEDINESDFKK